MAAGGARTDYPIASHSYAADPAAVEFNGRLYLVGAATSSVPTEEFVGCAGQAVNRFDRDVFNQAGVRYLIVFEGVNDIGGASASGSPALATNLIAAYTQFANKAHARNIRAYGATITPFGGNGYYTTPHEDCRQTVNAWFRTNTVFDGVIDFDAAVRDPVTLTSFQAAFFPGANANDGLHMNPRGYKAMADAIDLNLFTP